MNLKSIVALACAAGIAVSVHAQGVYIGPEIGYTVSTSVPFEVSSSGAPTRVRVGASLHLSGKSKVDFRFSLGYRTEGGTFRTDYVNPADSVATQGRLHVVEPKPGGPNVLSELTSSSVELSAEGFLPLGDLDTSGSKIGLTLGFFGDRVISASQTDDYQAVEGYTGPRIVQVQYQGQFGFGVLVGLSAIIPMGDSHIVFDVKYIVRQPSTLATNTAPSVDQNVGWLIGKGLRISAGYLLPI